MSLLRRRGPTEWAEPEPIEPERIRRAIDWAMANDFWSGVIQSPNGLRNNWEKLRASAKRQPQQPGRSGPRTGYQMADDRKAAADLLEQFMDEGRSLEDYLRATMDGIPDPPRQQTDVLELSP